MKTKKASLRRLLIIFLCLCILGITALTVINSIVKLSAGDQIINSEDAAKLEDIDCILVLGCFVKDDGRPSDMLFDRLTRGVELYDLGAAPKLLMSGDHGREEYDEVAAMKQFAIDEGIPSEDVFMDHAGFSTYESIYRAKEVFQADKILIVTQEYHLYRALYIANQLGVEAYGVSSDYHTYVGQFMRDFREMLARVKDCATCIFKPEPTYLGDSIPIFGDGNLTNDGNTDFS
jgi:vancomycin permeability regulator SanA